MKVKKFDNIWTMGLMIFGATLVLFYIAKLFFPQFIVGVAEIPNIVKFGNFIDSHKLFFYIFHFIIGFVSSYIYSCACCRVTKLDRYQTIILLSFLIFGMYCQEFIKGIYAPYNYASIVIMPLLMLVRKDGIGKHTFISTAVCFTVDVMAQALSMEIRNVVVMTTCVNSASMFILLIDLIIWRMLFYMFFNHKRKE